jgi:hypothetical protein
MALSKAEQLQILEEIARDPTNNAARIAAIRLLIEISPPEVSSGFEDLDEICLRRSGKPLGRLSRRRPTCGVRPEARRS